ncbi:hypothetical protein A3H65_03010 [Candidatus Giovannonibacteria bacterium RIFCSPLOWO2_02_FULL_45_14]|uniref:Uncharacterized protein n=1 Tax=Candidatus Giovannonibacteria bacterium RIFCSPLOWO2_12_FULL_44_15 TaxID=1798364 RepID=A0A1F5Y004_9BACT|nr:MAG: hypothetical protein A3C75_00985 [Candidatus Giovannonibacteria bacterium RIFCSPHIGHO2_02_FULL_44_31]OGF76394.1 MAG: hypothetical protein A3E62_03215 [Candidatus Giovannonibacteria bacterium RIFCSPHIGHO2_12_FULL_44_29]OGF90881.1 MAG: hypothetical protein A3H65_03010 [Candidatus Giovannonibacteria bacterium RIFCSPLOWO2_02_FULL_45_14]OGF93527.1 MAG: hypothetical protein A3G54_01110 [Candidatus Giovannonibacteria bacterium RIFCSPLOWO2_12_FULL_44_15]
MLERIPENAPETFNTHSPHLRGHFENYREEAVFKNGEPEYDETREEIAKYYEVPFTTEEDEEASRKENHIFIVDNKIVSRQRNHRAFCVITRNEGEKKSAWYIDGRLPHATMLNRLYNYYNVPDDNQNEINLGFLDYEGFPDIEEVQKKSKEIGKPITWFLRTTTSPNRGQEHLIK